MMSKGAVFIENKTLLQKENKFQLFLYGYMCILFSFIIFKLFQYDRGDDVGFFVSRINALAESISKQGLWFTLQNRVLNLENTWYGYSPNLFYGIFLLIPCAYLHLLGVPSLICYRVVLVLGMLLGFATTFWVLKKHLKTKLDNYIIATLSFIFVLIAPNLGDLLNSQNIRVVTLFCLPLGMHNLYQMFQTEKVQLKNVVGLIFAVAFNLLNHNLTAIVLVVTLLVEYIYLCIQSGNAQKIIYTSRYIVISAIVCLGLCASFILPMMEQALSGIYVMNYGQVDINGAGNVNKLLPGSLISFPLALALSSSIAAQNQGGYLLYLLILAYTSHLVKEKKHIAYSISYIILIIVLAVLPLPIFLKIFQFRFRLYAILNPVYILLLAYGLIRCSEENKKTICIILLVILTISFCFMLMVYGGLPAVDFSQPEIGGGDYLIYNENYISDNPELCWFYRHVNQKKNIENTIQNLTYPYSSNINGISFICPADDIITIPLIYYKGYSVYEMMGDNNIFIKDIISYTEDGLVLLDNTNQTLTGKNLHVQYDETSIQKISNIISIITLFFVCIFLTTYCFKKRRE